jgi:hypothetical protein
LCPIGKVCTVSTLWDCGHDEYLDYESTEYSGLNVIKCTKYAAGFYVNTAGGRI